MSEFQQVQTISDRGIALVKMFTGYHSSAFCDDSGAWVVGYGHAGTVDGRPVASGVTVTVEQAETLLRSDLLQAEVAVREYITRPLKQCEFDALVSFQLSGGRLRCSTLRHLLNAAAPAEQCAREFLKAVYLVRWIPASTRRGAKSSAVQTRVISRALQNRRIVERDFFLGRR